MRLGAQKCKLVKPSLAYNLYKKNIITERHRHRYEVNNSYINNFNDTDLLFSGYSGNKELMEILELKNHPWYLASQFHPEFTSSPMKGHPLFNSFIKTAYMIQNKHKLVSKDYLTLISGPCAIESEKMAMMSADFPKKNY